MTNYVEIWIQPSVCYIRCADTQTCVYQRTHATAGAGEEMPWVGKAARNPPQM